MVYGIQLTDSVCDARTIIFPFVGSVLARLQTEPSYTTIVFVAGAGQLPPAPLGPVRSSGFRCARWLEWPSRTRGSGAYLGRSLVR